MKKLSVTDLKAKENLTRIWEREQKKRGFTQDSAAAEIAEQNGDKTSQAKLSHYLSGHLRLTISAVLMFSSYLKVAPENIRDDFNYGYRPDPLDERERDTIESFRKLSEDQKRVHEALTHTMVEQIAQKYL